LTCLLFQQDTMIDTDLKSGQKMRLLD
jgi:hypothetical protein